jgi:hypothetical protein
MSTHTKTTRATARFHVKSWDEKPYSEEPGLPKLTRATVSVTYEGDVQGEGVTEYLMTHRDDGTASFVLVERVSGTLSGKEGSFVLQGSGIYDGKTAKGDMTVVPGSGTGDLRSIGGRGSFSAPRGPEGRLTLEVEF